MRLILFLSLISLIFISCDRPENNDKLICNYGEHKACTCDDGSDGKKLCKDNTWQACECKTEELCKDITCSGNGKCLVKSDKAVCECDKGYHVEGLNCIKDGETNPCDTQTCEENSHCIVENDEAKCICNSNYILNSENICIFDCSNLNNSHVNEDNNGCECDEGYHLNDSNLCIENDDIKCLNYECEDSNSHCIVENEEAKCVCNSGFVSDVNNICKLDCSSIEHSHANDDNTQCLCDTNYHFENNLCVSNEKTVTCNSITPPENAHQIITDLIIHWTQDNTWETIPDCDWECNENYQDKDNNDTCEPACTDTSCEHASCDDSSGKIDCICDAGYQDNDNDEICLPNCESTEVNGVACGGQGICYDDTGIINCICDTGYQDNDHDGVCKEKCHLDPLAPELSTCGKYGTCSDNSGEIVCSCNDGYFVSPTTGKCVSPCEDIDCGKHGNCVALSLNNISCNCDAGYQDNNNSLICKKSCASSCLTNSNGCDDSTGELICQCDNGYQDNDRDGSCLADCSNVTCNNIGQIPNSCNDNSGFAVCSYEQGYNYTNLISGTNEQIVNDSVIDSRGNLYLVGSFKGTVDFDPSDDGVDTRSSSGDDDIFITRINADNSYAWTYTIGSYSLDGAQAIAVDNYDNLYITGYFSSTVDFNPSSSTNLMRSNAYRDIFVLKITKYGEYSWSKSILSDETAIATSIKVDNDSIYLTGYLQGDRNTTINVDFDNTSSAGNFVVKGRKDGFIARFDINDGSYIWAKVFGVTNMSNSAQDVLVINNDIVVTGFIYGNDIDFGEGDEHHYISTNNKSQAFILKLTKDKQFVWLKTLESQTAMDVSKGVKLEKINNNFYLLGNLVGNIDFDTSDNQDIVNGGENLGIFIAKIDDNGDISDKEIFMASNSSSMLKDSWGYNDKLYLVGDISGSLNIQGTAITNSSSDNNKNDVFFTVLDSSLNVSLVNIFGGDLNDQAKAISIGSNGEIYILGEFEGTADFDPSVDVNNKTSQEMKDIFISRFTD